MTVRSSPMVRFAAPLLLLAACGLVLVAWRREAPEQFLGQRLCCASRTHRLENVWFDPRTRTVTGTVLVTDSNGLLNCTAGALLASDYDRQVWPIVFRETPLDVQPVYSPRRNELRWEFSHELPRDHRFGGVRLVGGTYFWSSRHRSLKVDLGASLVTGYILNKDLRPAGRPGR